MRLSRLVLLALVACLGLCGKEISGLCVSVADGDTLSVVDASRQRHRIRLYGIDSPERSQPYGGEARSALNNLAYRQQLRVVVVDRDRYGRVVGEVYANGRNLNVEMVRQGLAWHYVYFAKNNGVLAAAEASARQQRLGLWSQERPQAPWDYRRQQRGHYRRR